MAKHLLGNSPCSKVLFRRCRNPSPKYWTLHWRIQSIEWVHQILDPGIVHLHHELPHGLLRRSRGGIRRNTGSACARTAPKAGGGETGARGQRRIRLRGEGGMRIGSGGIRVMQEEELDVTAGEKARDVIVVEAVNMLEIPGFVSEPSSR